jgi:hypothetical protein
MGVVGIILVIFIIRALAEGKDQKSASKANSAPTPWFPIRFFVFWGVVSAASAWIIVLSPIAAGIFSITGTLLLCFPSWVAQITIRLGWVKASYYLGGHAQAIHTRDPYSGALFYGWRALQHVKQEKREPLRDWLQTRLSNRKSVLRSGTMVVQVLLKHGQISDNQLMEQLRLLSGCNKRLIPGNISRYCFRYMLARDLPTGDWRLIRATTVQWLDAGYNPLAKWLHELCWNRQRAHKWHIRLFLFYRYLLAGMPKIARYLPADEVQVDEESNSTYSSLDDLKLAEWAALKSVRKPDAGIAQHWKDYVQQNREQWCARLQALGSYNPEEGFAKISQSVQDLLAYSNSHDALESEQVSEERDRDFRLLRIKINAVNQRLHSQLMTGAQELEEWFAMAHLAQKLATDAASESQVFYMLRGCCWNWIARLWNDANAKPLAFLICSYMSTLAYNASDTEALAVFSGIVADRYK